MEFSHIYEKLPYCQIIDVVIELPGVIVSGLIDTKRTFDQEVGRGQHSGGEGGMEGGKK